MIARILLAWLLLSLAGQPALAQSDFTGLPARETPVATQVRAAAYADRYRMAIEFRDRPDHQVRIEGGNLVLEFDRPVLLDFAPARASLGDRLGEARVSEFGRRVVVPLGDGRRVSDSIMGSNLVLDLFPYPPPPPPPLPVIAYGLAFQDFDRLVFSFAAPVTAELQTGGDGARVVFAMRGALDQAAFDLRGLKIVRTASGKLVNDRLVVEVEAPPDAQFHLRSLGDVVELDVAGPGVELQRDAPLIQSLTAAAAESAHPLAGPRGPGPRTFPLGGGLTLELSRPQGLLGPPAPGRGLAWPQPLGLTFAWDEPTGLAALRLDEGLLLLFDRPAPQGLQEMLRAADAALADVRHLPLEGATALLLPLAHPLQPAIELEGSRWYLDLRPRHPPMMLGPSFARRDGAAGSELHLGMVGGRRPIPLDLPDGGGRLLVVPLAAAGQAVPQPLRLPQATLLPTLQGLAVLPLADGVRLSVDAAGITLAAEGGLLMSAGLDDNGRLGGGAAGQEGRQASLPLFDLPAWRRGSPADFDSLRRELQDAVLRASPSQAAVERLELARFLFAHGLGAETVGELRLVEEANPALAADPKFKLLLGAALVLDGKTAEAAAPLSAAVLNGEPDAALWRAVLAAEARDWVLADGGFLAGQSRIAEYPRSVRSRLRLDSAESALEARDETRAAEQLELAALDVTTRPEETRLAYLQARQHLLRGEKVEARAALRRAADGTATAAGARARLLQLDLDLEEGTLALPEAVEALERLTYAWRGDAFEFELARRLSELQWQAGQPRASLRTLRQALTSFPDAAGVDAAAEVMASRFREAMLEVPEEGFPALQALALYEEFRELTPAGPEGERLIGSLADRLVAMDLLGRAAALLEHQVDFRLAGEAKSRAGVRLAEVLLLDRKPREALMALDRSAAAELPEDLSIQRRLLRARALADSGRLEQGLGLLDLEESPGSAELRAELLWEAGDWPRAAQALRELLPSRSLPRVREKEGLLVLRTAIAYTLAGDPAGVARLRDDHAHQLAGGPVAEVFALLAENDGGRSVQEELAAVRRAQAFMAQYRQESEEADSDPGVVN